MFEPNVPHCLQAEEIKSAFKLGLVKAAKTTSAWILTGGTNHGVMKLVGDAVAEDLNANDITVLGITSWGTVGLEVVAEI